MEHSYSKNKAILVIDDEPDIRTYLMAVLEDCGYQPLSAEGDQDLAIILRQQTPDLILLDIMMPTRSGIGVYRELKSMAGYQHIPVVIISGMDYESEFSDTLLRKHLLPPPDGFVSKPINIPALLEVVNRLLEF